MRKLIRYLRNNKIIILLLIIISLLLNNVALNLRYQKQAADMDALIKQQEILMYDTISSIYHHSQYFLVHGLERDRFMLDHTPDQKLDEIMSNNGLGRLSNHLTFNEDTNIEDFEEIIEYNIDYLIWRQFKVFSSEHYRNAEKLGLDNFKALMESGFFIWEMYNVYNSITRDEMIYLLTELNKDLANLAVAYLGTTEAYAHEGRELSVNAQGLYNRAHGKDREFNKLINEHMENIMIKYHNISVEDIR